LRVEGLGFRFEGLGFTVQGSGFKVWGLGFMNGFRIQDLMLRVED
jgi:hypothetical protein